MSAIAADHRPSAADRPRSEDVTVEDSSTFFQSMYNRLDSIIHSETTDKVAEYILQAGSFIVAIPSYGIRKLYNFYSRLAHSINWLCENAVLIASGIALATLFPVPTLIGGAIGFATTHKYKILELLVNVPKLTNYALTVIGGLAAVAMPAGGALSTLAICAGTFGLGRAVHDFIFTPPSLRRLI